MHFLIVVILVILVIVNAVRASRAQKYNKEVLRDRDRIGFLLENLNDGIIEYDADWKITRMNQAAEHILGIAPSDVIGKKIEKGTTNPKEASLASVSFPLGSEVNRTKTEYSEALGMSIDTHELDVTYPSEIHLKVFTIPKLAVHSNTPVGYIKIVRDITRETAINQSKSDLVTVVAHQLRTPLSGVKWIFQALVDGDYGPLADEQKTMITRGLEANDDMTRLIDDILDVSKIEEANFEYKLEEKDFVEFLQHLTDELKEALETRKLSLKLSLPKDKVPYTFDTKRMSMAINNLLDNAITYSNEGGSIKLSMSEKGGKINLDISDSGIGIPEEDRSQIFSKFYRAENAKRFKTHGTGLGLFLVKSIVSGHGGTISFESEKDKGTTFHIELPLKPTGPTPSPVKLRGASKMVGI